jgi:hypothetical protein
VSTFGETNCLISCEPVPFGWYHCLSSSHVRRNDRRIVSGNRNRSNNFFLVHSTTAINGDTLNGDSDISSTSSQTSSEHDPALRTHLPTYNVSPSTNWPDETATYFPPPPPPPSNLISSPQLPNKPVVSNSFNSPKDMPTNEATVKTLDQLPEYKLFGSNGPSIHSLLFGTSENTQQPQRPVTNGIDHDLRAIEKRLMGKIDCILLLDESIVVFDHQKTAWIVHLTHKCKKMTNLVWTFASSTNRESIPTVFCRVRSMQFVHVSTCIRYRRRTAATTFANIHVSASDIK